MRRSVLLTAGMLGAVLSACGTERSASGPPGASSAADEAPLVVAGGEVMVSCGSDGGAGWPPSVMTEGVRGVLTDREARRVFQGILSDPMTGEEASLSLFPDGVAVDWRVLRADACSLTIGLGRWTEHGPVEGPHVLELARDGEAWRATGWAECQLSPVLEEGNDWAEVTGYEGDAASARLTAEVSERECTSGRDPRPFLHEPLVVETRATVTIYWTTEPPRGGHDCQGNPSVRGVVELDRPLGTRAVLDGSSYPARQVRPG